MTKVLWAALMALSVVLPWPASDVRSAVVQARVVDAAGQPVAGLTAADFDLHLNGTLTPVASVTPRGTLSLAVVVDTTRSAGWSRGGWLQPPREQVLAVLAGLGDEDRLRFGSFGARVTFLKGWQPRRDRDLAAELNKILSADEREMAGPSPIWDVLHDTVSMLAAEPPPRAILLVSDGRSTGNAHSLETVAEHAAVNGVALHSLVRYVEMQIPQGGVVAIAVRPWIPFERLSLYTGGTVVAYATNESPHGLDLAAKLGHSIRGGYALSFASPAGGAVHRLEVRAKRPDLKVLAPLAFAPSNPR